MNRRSLKLGTRGSPLALWQAEAVRARLLDHHPSLAVEIVPIKTMGDRIQDRPLSEVGGKGLFVKEIEEALLLRTIDVAVHSVKDVPSVLPESLQMAVILKREEYRDAWVSRGETLLELPHGAIVGTSSLRRRAFLLKDRPDLDIRDCRGNVDTRLKKLDEGQYDAIILSAAGLDRLGCSSRIVETLDTWIPAVGQGVMGLETRDDDHDIKACLSVLHDEDTGICVRAERAYLRALEGNCQVPIGCFASLDKEADRSDRTLLLRGMWVHPKTGALWTGHLSGKREDAEALGEALAKMAKS